jgi:hypothetical protein
MFKTKSRGMRWTGNMACYVGNEKCIKILVSKPEEEKPFWGHRLRLDHCEHS